MNSPEVTLLVLTDLSSAFDTAEHLNLLSHLQTKAGVAGRVLDWFKSYLSGRSQRVSVQGSKSNKFPLQCIKTILQSNTKASIPRTATIVDIWSAGCVVLEMLHG